MKTGGFDVPDPSLAFRDLFVRKSGGTCSSRTPILRTSLTGPADLSWIESTEENTGKCARMRIMLPMADIRELLIQYTRGIAKKVLRPYRQVTGVVELQPSTL
jgi:hypothetical protein